METTRLHGPATPLLSAEHVTKTFGATVALKHVSFAVPEGQVCGLLGPNGSGKTTLFRLMMGILKPTSGSLTIAGLNAFDDRVALKRMMGYLPDEPIFYAYMSGREILELSAAMHGRLVEPTMQELAPLIEALRLDTELDHYADDYSRGTKKKLGLLLALLHRPRLLVLDEPTNGLDVESTHRFYEIVRAEAARGTTVLLSTHLMDHVTAICSHVIVIDKGSVKASGDLDELRTQYGGVTIEQVFLHLTTGSPV